MSVVYECRSPLPFPQLECEETLLIPRPSGTEIADENREAPTSILLQERKHLPVPLPSRSGLPSSGEVNGEIAANLSEEPARIPWIGSRLHLAATIAFAVIAVASFFVWSGREVESAQSIKNQNFSAHKPVGLLAIQEKAEFPTHPPTHSASGQFDKKVEDLDSPFEAVIGLGSDFEESVSAESVGCIASDLAIVEPVEDLPVATDRDNSAQKPELPKDDSELVVASKLFFGPDPAPPGFQNSSSSLPSGLPTHGTAISWMPTLNDAIDLAKKTDKLVFLLQVSGNFALEEFT